MLCVRIAPIYNVIISNLKNLQLILTTFLGNLPFEKDMATYGRSRTQTQVAVVETCPVEMA